MTPTRKFRFTVSWPKLAGELERKSKDPKVSLEKRKNAEKSAHSLRAFMPLHWKLRNQHYAGIDPEFLQDGITLARFHIGAGARSFADFTNAMVGDIGELVRPYLKWFYNTVRDYPGADTTGFTPHDEMDVEPVNAESPEVKAGKATLTKADYGSAKKRNRSAKKVGRDRYLLKMLATRLAYLFSQEKDPQAAMQEISDQMWAADLLETQPTQDQDDPEAFAEEVTLLNPVLLSKAPFLRERDIDVGQIDSLNDWVEKLW